jgi:hypothetical protein
MPVNPQHSTDVREGAYMHWAYENERNLTETSRKLDIPLRTLAYWKRVDEWDKKYKEDNLGVAGLAFEAAIEDLQVGMNAVAHQIIRDSTNETLDHNERIASQRLFLSLFNPEQSGPSVLTLIDARQQSLNALQDTVLPNPRIAATRVLEANISDALAQQTKTKSKR